MMGDETGAGLPAVSPILIYGPFGGGDFSAEWSLQVLLEWLKAHDLPVTVASRDDRATAEQHHANALPLGDPHQVERSLLNSRMALWVAGTLEDIPPTEVAPRADLLAGRCAPDLAVSHLAMLCDVPVVGLDLSVRASPLGLRAQPLWLKAVQGCRFAAVRDVPSRETLQTCLGSGAVVYQADLRFVPSPRAPAPAPAGAPRLVVLWRQGVTRPEYVREACAKWIEERGPTARLAVGALGRSAGAEESLASIVGDLQHAGRADLVGQATSAQELSDALSRATLVLAMEAAGVIAAWRQRVPVVAIAGDNETRDLLARVGHDDRMLSPGEAAPDTLGRLLAAGEPPAGPQLDDFISGEASRANAVLEHLLAVLQGEPPAGDEALARTPALSSALWRAAPTDRDTARLHRRMREAEARVNALEFKLQAGAKGARLEELDRQLQQRDERLRQLEQELQRVAQELRAIEQTRAWRWASKLALVKRCITHPGRRGRE